VFARYNRIVLGAIGLFGVTVIVVALFQEPFEGDLTRIGGYSERYFGWQGKREFFKESYLYKVAHSVTDLDQHYDMVIWGDSFSRRAHFSWASYLADATGWKIIQFHHNEVGFIDLISSEQFRRHPPEILVLQSVERHVVRRLSELRRLEATAAATGFQPPLMAVSELHAPKELRARETEFEDFNDRLAAGVHWLNRKCEALFSGENGAVEARLSAEAPRLFSARSRDATLILADDFKLRRVWKGRVPAALEGYRRAEQAVQAQGSGFVLLIFPDKLTAYADYLQDQRWRESSVIPAIAQAGAIPRLDLDFHAALEKGMVDLYPANNTHTGSDGSHLAAESLLRFIQSAGVARLSDVNVAEKGNSSGAARVSGGG
jgi:hypothetical protein